MIFGPTPLQDALGAILAHGTRHAGGIFKKGRVLSAEDIVALADAGHVSVVAARLSPDDVPEDEAARAVSRAACGSGARAQESFTGRANLHSTAKGLLVLDEARIQALNNIHESLTIATLPNHARVQPRHMVATIKVIPFAVPRAVLDKALALIGHEALLRVAPFAPKQAGLIITRLSQTKPGIIEKSRTAIADRLAQMGASLAHSKVVPHTEQSVSLAITELLAQNCSPILLFGASAIVDRADVIPAAVVRAGGKVIHLGMPVDPGNLLMLGELGATAVVGVPSCARSPKVNGFDWVLERLIADLPVTREDVMAMGLGGLLSEIPSRPSPREGKSDVSTSPRVVAVVLAAGRSSRMGSNKMLADFRGQTMVRATVERICRSTADEVIVITGHESRKVQSVLAGLPVRCVENPDFAQGLSTSLAAAVKSAGNAHAIVVCLGDMPLLEPRTIDRMIAAYDPAEHRSIIVPTYKGQPGNPVLWGAGHFRHLLTLKGDSGARALLAGLKPETAEIAVDDHAILLDADTPEALAEMRAAKP
jgi:molybdenum cofactor cytidylyltransferase